MTAVLDYFRAFKARLLSRYEHLKLTVMRLPVEAKTVAGSLSFLVAALSIMILVSTLKIWSQAVAEAGVTKPRINQYLGYIESAPLIQSELAAVNVILEDLVIADSSSSGRGGALLQQQLRQIAGAANLTVVGSEVKEPEQGDVLVQLRVAMQVSGDPEDFLAFLSQVYLASPALFLEKVEMEALRRINRRRQPSMNKGLNDHLMARLEVSAYLLGKSGA